MKKLLILPVVVSLAALSNHSVHAVDRTWDAGGANTLWNTAANWSGDTNPTVGDNAIVPAGSFQVHPNSNMNLGSGTFTAGAGTIMRVRGASNTITLTTGGFSLAGNTTANPSRFERLSTDGTADFTFTVAGPSTLGGGSLSFNNNNSLAGNFGLTFATTSLTINSGSNISITGPKPFTLMSTNPVVGNGNVIDLSNGLFSLTGTTNYSTLGLSIATAAPAAAQYNVFQNNTVASLLLGGNSVAAGTYNAAQLNAMPNGANRFVDNGGTLTIVPEPTTFAMLLGGAGLLTMLRRRSSR